MRISSRPSSPASPMSQDLVRLADEAGSLRVVSSFASPLEAELAKGRLEAAGIPAALSDQHTVSIAWHLSQAVGGVKVKVAEEDEERAREVLCQVPVLLDAPPEYSEDDALPVPCADAASRERPPDKATLARRALTASMLGVVFLPPLTVYSLTLLSRYLSHEDGSTPQDRAQALLALAFDLVALLTVVCWLGLG